MSIVAPAVCKHDPGVFTPLIDLKRCEGKGECVRVCPENVFELRRIEDADYRNLGLLNKFKLRMHGMVVAYKPNLDACRACGLCVASCPEDAIILARTTKKNLDDHPQ